MPRKHAQWVAAVSAIGVIVIVLVGGQLLAIQRSDAASAGLGRNERDAATTSAQLFWDNPFQQLAFRAYGVTRVPRSGPDRCTGSDEGPMYRVTAYTLFGLQLDQSDCGATTP